MEVSWTFPSGEHIIVVGELLKLFFPGQEQLATEAVAYIRWLKPSDDHPLAVDLWSEYK